MNDTGTMLADAAARLFTDVVSPGLHDAAEAGDWPRSIWQAVEDSGLHLATRADARGGAGASPRDVAALLRVAGAHALPVPLAETLLAEQLLAAAALAPRSGALSIGPVLSADGLHLSRAGGRWRLSGVLHRVPWGRHVQSVVVIATHAAQPTTVVAHAPKVERDGKNYAFEPRDDLRFDDIVLDDEQVGTPGRGASVATLQLWGALYRSLAMAGALGRVLDMTVRYAGERIQFGRAIGKFQAVQQQIAHLATEVAAAGAAASAAADRSAGAAARFEIAAAKARVGEAAGTAARIAHQVHAAMGFTREHGLHRLTRRLWSWRDEFGTETEWYTRVGAAAANIGGENLWAFLTDPHAEEALGTD